MNKKTNQEVEKLSEEIHKLYCAQYELDHGEPYKTGGDYSKLDEKMKEYDRNIARFIINNFMNLSIDIPLVDLELEELADGKEFNWVFPTEMQGQDVKIHLYLDNDSNE